MEHYPGRWIHNYHRNGTPTGQRQGLVEQSRPRVATNQHACTPIQDPVPLLFAVHRHREGDDAGHDHAARPIVEANTGDTQARPAPATQTCRLNPPLSWLPTSSGV